MAIIWPNDPGPVTTLNTPAAYSHNMTCAGEMCSLAALPSHTPSQPTRRQAGLGTDLSKHQSTQSGLGGRLQHHCIAHGQCWAHLQRRQQEQPLESTLRVWHTVRCSGQAGERVELFRERSALRVESLYCHVSNMRGRWHTPLQ